MKIIRGYKKREYEKYRLSAWHIHKMALIKKSKAALRDFDWNEMMPPYEELELSAEDKAKLKKAKIKMHVDAVKDKDAKIRKRLIKEGVIKE